MKSILISSGIRAVQSIAEHDVIGMDWYAPGSTDQVPGGEREEVGKMGAYKGEPIVGMDG